ncbi:MAG: hypothetical protein Q4D07_09490 [Selenomonadaceae bacterium]|nr:hypothetical protein [Selenomonadaceae bacterium]
MVVEILGFIIIAGALVYIFLRRRGVALFGDSTGLESAEVTAEKIRYEMEKSADEIINRLAEHIDRLESLISQAEEVSAKLDGRLTKLRREIHTAQESGILPVMTAEQLKTVATNPAAVQTAATQAAAASPYGAGNMAAQLAADEADAEEATAFSRLLDSTIEETEAAALDIAALPNQNRAVEPSEPISEAEEKRPKRIDYYARARELKEQMPVYPESGVEAIKPLERAAAKAVRVSAVSELSPTDEARRLMAAGYATEDIARRVHLGKGAIELLRQMDGQGK